MQKNIQYIINYYNFGKTSFFRVIVTIFFKFYKIFFLYIFNYKKKITTYLRKRTYDEAWSNPLRNYKLWFDKNEKKQLFFYKKFFFSSGAIARRIFQYYTYEIIKKKNLKNVLEIGSGNGINLCLLASYFENTSFQGIDISSEGINQSNILLKSDLSDNFFDGMPIKPATKKLKNIKFSIGDASSLKFENHNFDLVFSILALEQMDHIKENVIKEMIRVSSKYILFIEPFIDYNQTFLKKLHHRGSSYFSHRVEDLKKYNLKIIDIYSDHPNKITLGVCAVLCEKK